MTDLPFVRFGRKAEMGGNAPLPRRWRSTFVDVRAYDFRYRMYIIAARRITSGELLKYR